MVTGNVVEELVHWGRAVSEGNAKAAGEHLRQFYHLGATLVASKEFQAAWRVKRHKPLEPAQLDDACDLLTMIAEVEADQLAEHGKARSAGD
jgi:hypothetical protein